MNHLLHDPRIRFLDLHPSPHNSRVKDQLLLTSVVVLNEARRSLDFVSTFPTLEYAQWGGRNTEYWRFFHGTTDTPLAMDLMQQATYSMCQRERKQYLTWYATIWYDVPQRALKKLPLSWDDARNTELLNISHLDEQAHRTLLDCAQQLLQEFAAVRRIPASLTSKWMLQEVTLHAILVRWPELVWLLLDELPQVQVLVHHAAIKVDCESHELQIATLKADPRRIKQVNVLKYINCRLALPHI